MNTEISKGTKLAHVILDENGKIVAEQSLVEHLINTGKHAAELGRDINCFYLSFLLGILHDLGKCKEVFQKLILGELNKNINHSSAGASYLLLKMRRLQKKINSKGLIAAAQHREILFYVITAHHGLYDAIGKGQNIEGEYVSRIEDRMALEEDKIALEKEIQDFVDSELEPAILKELNISFDVLILRALRELQDIISKIEALIPANGDGDIKTHTRKVYEGFLTRLFLSILKTADCLDSMQFAQEKEITPLRKEELNEIFREYHLAVEERAGKFAANAGSSPLNKARTELSALAKEHALNQECGISQFEMPTGAGKTEAGLRYAVNNITKFGKRRFVYTAPFLSIAEQTARTVKNVVGEKHVLEHHSNVVNGGAEDGVDKAADETKSEENLYMPITYVTDYWDAPIIVTTMVQLYDTLFGGKAANICRFSKLIDSIIIIDEIQSLPVNHIYCFNLMLNFLSRVMKANILLCSATQPPLGDESILDYPLMFSSEKQVIPPNGELKKLGRDAIDYSVFERSQVFPAWPSSNNDEYMLLDDVTALLLREMAWADSGLCVLNTKKAVQALFEKVEKEFSDAKLFYLTTNLCAAHRLDIISEMRTALRAIREGSSDSPAKLICISTSLIEAGVDVDFDLVLRSAAGADSIEQTRGRCNREGLLRDGGKVFILRLKEDKTDVKGLRDIYERGNITASFVKNQIKEELRALNMRLLVEDFYKKYFLENSGDMVFKMSTEGRKNQENTSALELLSTNDVGIPNSWSFEEQDRFRRKHRLLQSFKTVSKYMKLIDQDTKAVIVPYENEELRKKLIEAIDLREFTDVKKLLKRLQRYTVNVYGWQEVAQHCYFINEELGIYMLRSENYDSKIGINADSEAFIL